MTYSVRVAELSWLRGRHLAMAVKAYMEKQYRLPQLGFQEMNGFLYYNYMYCFPLAHWPLNLSNHSGIVLRCFVNFDNIFLSRRTFHCWVFVIVNRHFSLRQFRLQLPSKVSESKKCVPSKEDFSILQVLWISLDHGLSWSVEGIDYPQFHGSCYSSKSVIINNILEIQKDLFDIQIDHPLIHCVWQIL